MFNNKNPYSLRIEIKNGAKHYFVSFNDRQKNVCDVEVTRPSG